MEVQDLKGTKLPKSMDVRVMRAFRMPLRDPQEGYTGLVDVAQPGETRKLDAMLALEQIAAKRAALIGSQDEREFLENHQPAAKAKAAG